MLSFKHWITLGIVAPKDLVFVIQKEHVEKHNMQEKLRSGIHTDIQVVIIDGLTRGPAETGFLGIQGIDLEESILINDCDHHFQSSGLLRTVKKYLNFSSGDEIHLTCTNPVSVSPSWSYLELSEGDSMDYKFVTGIKEKDIDLMRSGAKGVVGAYFFSSRALFEKLYKNAFKNESGEYFISRIVQHAITQKIRVLASQAAYGFPLGNQSEITRFVRAIKEGAIHFNSSTILCDIDGVIIEHDTGYHSKGGAYDYNARLLDENVLRIRNQYLIGSYLCLTTARPERERVELENYLKKHKVPYDELLMGMNPGPRILINDRKNSETAINTALAFSNIRNQQIPSLQLQQHLGWDIAGNLTGGSGVETLRLKDIHLGSFIRKCVPSTPEFEKHKDILKLQNNWYAKVQTYLPGSLPKTLYCGEDRGFFVLDMEDLGSLENFRDAKIRFSQNTTVSLFENLFRNLNGFYEPFQKISKGSVSNAIITRNNLIGQKALPAIELLSRQDRFPFRDMNLRKDILVNGSLIENPINKLNSIAARNKSLLGSFSQIQTLIHGDLTYENILVNGSNPLLIDPLGAFMDPDMQSRQEHFLESVSPIWDLIKLLQSALLDYEAWNYAANICTFDSKNGINTNGEIVFSWKSPDIQLIIEQYSNFGLDLTESNLNLMLAILMFRLIPYKIPLSMEKSMYCFTIGSKLLEAI